MFAHRSSRHAAPTTRRDGSRYAPSAHSMTQETGAAHTRVDAVHDAPYSDFGLAMVHTADTTFDDDPPHGDPLARATAIHSLDPKVDGGLEVRTEAAVAEASRAEEAAWNAPFRYLDADPKLGFTMPTAGPNADPSMAVRVGRPGERRRQGEDSHQDATGIETLADYRAMVVQDFNFGGLVERLAGVPSLDGQKPEALRASGEAAFRQLAIARFHPGMSLDDPAAATTMAVADNIWSYATCGHDVEGRTDISELQGLLYLFDREIRASSDTNTEMAGGSDAKDWFVIPGTEDWDVPLKAKRGDGRHGTATVRTTRHLMAKLDDNNLRGFDESFLLLDRTSSMGTDEYQHLSSLLDLGGLDGSVALASFEANVQEVNNGAQMTQGLAQQHLKHPTGALQSGGGAEYTMKTALDWLQTIQNRGDGANGTTVSRQLVIVTDAPDNAFTSEDLRQVQALATEMHMSVKVMFSYVSTQTDAYELAGADEYILVDIMKLDPNAIDSNWMAYRAKEYNKYQLDWRKVGLAQGATPQRWPDE